MSNVFVHGSQNMLRKSSYHEAKETLQVVCNRIHVAGLQEVESAHIHKAVREVKQTREFAAYIPDGTAGALPIIWRTDIFKSNMGHGSKMTSRGRAGVSPTRHFTWQPLTHRATGARCLVLNTQAISGYANNKFPKTDDFRDKSAKLHWEIGIDLTRKAIKSDKYDVILLGGDFNCRLENHAERWYPGIVLKPYYILDDVFGIDRLLFTKGSRVESESRTSTKKGIHSDHGLALQKLKIVMP